MNKGFTLIEVLISITILGILAAMIGFNRPATTGVMLFKNQAQLISVINQAKAMTLQKFGSTSTCGYGISIASDLRTYQLIRNDINNGVCPGISNVIQNFILDSGLRFSSSFDIIFLGPYLIATSTTPNLSFPWSFAIKSNSGQVVSSTINIYGTVY
ncbi:MAG: type II secretion system protein [Minisyncoccia bacterium]